MGKGPFIIHLQHFIENGFNQIGGVVSGETNLFVYSFGKIRADNWQTWLRLEGEYLPWRDYGDLEHPARGGFWHRQLHVFTYPLYYIDYVLAATCALQFLGRARADREEAWRSYVALCGRGGSLRRAASLSSRSKLLSRLPSELLLAKELGARGASRSPASSSRWLDTPVARSVLGASSRRGCCSMIDRVSSPNLATMREAITASSMLIP